MTDNKVSRRSILHAGAGTAAAAATVALPTMASAKELAKISRRMQALWDGGTTPMRSEEMFAKRVVDLPRGQFDIRVFSGGQIVPSNNGFSAVRSGAFELLKTNDGYVAGRDPVFAFTSSVPFGF